MDELRTIANRAGTDGRYELPEDGWYQLAPLGTFPVTVRDAKGRSERLVQILDEQACDAIANRFRDSAGEAGMLIDYDHASLDQDKSTEAAGWIQEVASRGADGLWGRIRWTNRGREAVTGGAFRYLSPAFDRGAIEQLGGGRVRPLALLNAALTNDPNLKGIRPLSNRRGAEDTATGGGDAANEEEREMKEALARLLNLQADAADDAVIAGVQALVNRAGAADAAEARVTELERRQLEADVEADLAEFAGCIRNRDQVKAQLMADRDGTRRVLEAMVPAASATGEGALPNRRTGTVPDSAPDAAAGKADAARAAAIRNRASVIEREQLVSYRQAFALAEKELTPAQ